MKTLISIIFFFISSSTFSQIGVLTLSKNDDIQMGMWYTVNQKGRHNNLYITYRDKETAQNKLLELLTPFEMSLKKPHGKDERGDSYWIVKQDCGWTSKIYFAEQRGWEVWTITIVTED